MDPHPAGRGTLHHGDRELALSDIDAVYWRRPTSRTLTTTDPATIPTDDHSYRFLLQLNLHGANGLWRGPAHDPTTRTDHDAITATTADGNRADAFTTAQPDSCYRLIHTGTRRIWDTIDATHRHWNHLGHPNPFGISPTSRHGAWSANGDAGRGPGSGGRPAAGEVDAEGRRVAAAEVRRARR